MYQIVTPHLQYFAEIRLSHACWNGFIALQLKLTVHQQKLFAKAKWKVYKHSKSHEKNNTTKNLKQTSKQGREQRSDHYYAVKFATYVLQVGTKADM